MWYIIVFGSLQSENLILGLFTVPCFYVDRRDQVLRLESKRNDSNGKAWFRRDDLMEKIGDCEQSN